MNRPGKEVLAGLRVAQNLELVLNVDTNRGTKAR